MLRIENVTDDGPADTPEVALVVRRFDAELAEVLGGNVLFCLVIAEVRPNCTHMQAVTNTSQSEAREMMRLALERDFVDRLPRQ